MGEECAGPRADRHDTILLLDQWIQETIDSARVRAPNDFERAGFPEYVGVLGVFPHLLIEERIGEDQYAAFPGGAKGVFSGVFPNLVALSVREWRVLDR